MEIANLITLGVSRLPEFDMVLVDVDVGADVVKAIGIDLGTDVDEEIELNSIGTFEHKAPVLTITSVKLESSMVKPSGGSRMTGDRLGGLLVGRRDGFLTVSVDDHGRYGMPLLEYFTL